MCPPDREHRYFFKAFARLHPTKDFPHVSLLVLGALSIVASFVSLGMVGPRTLAVSKSALSWMRQRQRRLGAVRPPG